jgi:surface polysaccharide O-acyltransferase-like enzyme
MEARSAEAEMIVDDRGPLLAPVAAPVREWVGEFDVLRIVGALAVVLIHANARAVRAVGFDPHSPATVVSTMTHFAVPAFVMMAAGLAWSRDPKHGWADFLRRKSVSIGIPYLFWWTFYVAFISLAQRRWWPTRQLLIGLIKGTPSYHLYFIPIVFAMYLMTPFLRPLVRRSPEAAFAALFAVSWAGVRWDGRLPFTHAVMPGMSTLTGALYMLLPAAIGMWYLSRRDAFRRVVGKVWPLLLVIGFANAPAAALDIALPELPWFVGLFAGLVGLLGLCDAIARRSGTWSQRLKKISALTFGVYLIHPFVLWVSIRFAVAAGYPNVVRIWWTSMVLWLLVAPLCFAVVAGVRRFAVGRTVT